MISYVIVGDNWIGIFGGDEVYDIFLFNFEQLASGEIIDNTIGLEYNVYCLVKHE